MCLVMVSRPLGPQSRPTARCCKLQESRAVVWSIGESLEVLKTSLSGVPVVKVTGDVDHLTAPALERIIQQALGIDGAYLLLDLSDCQYLDSGGLSVLLFVCRQVRDEGWLGVIAPHPDLLRLFEIVGLTSARGFRVFSSSQEAMVALNDEERRPR